jgi:hypothetical protein
VHVWIEVALLGLTVVVAAQVWVHIVEVGAGHHIVTQLGAHAWLLVVHLRILVLVLAEILVLGELERIWYLVAPVDREAPGFDVRMLISHCGWLLIC